MQALSNAKERIQPLSEKVKEISQKAPELPKMMKEEMNNAQDTSFSTKLKAGKSMSYNTKALSNLPRLFDQLKLTVTSAFEELKSASEELTKKKDKLSEIGKQCKLVEKTSPKDCYLHNGDPIDTSEEAFRKWKAHQKTKE